MKRTTLALTVLLVLLFSVIILAIALNFISTTPTSTAPLKPEYVTVSGTANNTDHFDYASPTITPNTITFTSGKNGTTYETSFTGENYSLSLPNLDSYNVTINWQFNSIYADDSYAGTLNLNTTETSITKNWTSPYQYPLKPEYVTVSGTAVRIQHPAGVLDPSVLAVINIAFTSMRSGNSYGVSFDEGSVVYIPNGDYNVTGDYSISLPNCDSYNVTIRLRLDIIYGWSAEVGTFNLYATETAVIKDWFI